MPDTKQHDSRTPKPLKPFYPDTTWQARIPPDSPALKGPLSGAALNEMLWQQNGMGQYSNHSGAVTNVTINQYGPGGPCFDPAVIKQFKDVVHAAGYKS